MTYYTYMENLTALLPTLIPITAVVLGFTGALVAFVARHIDLNDQPGASFDIDFEADLGESTIIFIDTSDFRN